MEDTRYQKKDTRWQIPDTRCKKSDWKSEDELSEIEGEFKGNNRMLVYGGKIYVDINM